MKIHAAKLFTSRAMSHRSLFEMRSSTYSRIQFQDGGSKVKAFHDAVYSRMEHFLVVEVHFEIGREAQFVCQVFQDRLEERVDGFHPETVIVVQDMA